MDKQKFMNQLRNELRQLPVQEREEIEVDYEEYFEQAKLEGKTEEEVVQSLGNPKKIAKELMTIYSLEQLEKNPTMKQMIQSVFAVIGLSILNVFFVLIPFLFLAFSFFIGYLFDCTLFIAPLLKGGEMIIFGDRNFFELFFSLFLSGVAILFFLFLNKVFQICWQWFIRYLHWNIRVVKGE